MLNFACHTWPYQSYHVVFLQADQSQPWLRLFKVTKLHLDVVGWVRAPMLRWGVCFPPWFDAFLCYSWNWSRYRESSMGRGRSLSLITGAIEQACSLTEFCLVRTLDHSLRFLLPFLGLDVLKMSCSTTWSLNFWPFCQGFTCASHLDTILVSIVSIGSLSTAWCKLDCHTPVSRWGCGGCFQVGRWSCLWKIQVVKQASLPKNAASI